MVLFDCGRYYSGYADAVTTHRHNLISTVFVEHCRFECFRIFGSKLENMPNFNAALNLQKALTVWARITFYYIAYIFDSIIFAVAKPVCAAQVKAVFIGATDKV